MLLDHVAIAATDLAAGAAAGEAALGVPLLPGGQHLRDGTHNRLLGLGEGLYLEVIARDPGLIPEGPRWFGLDRFAGPPRPANWICAVPDLDAALAAAPASAGRARELSRGDLRWRIAVPDDGSLPWDGAFPTLIEWPAGITPPGQSLPDSGVRLTGWEVHHPEAGAIAARLPVIGKVSFHPGPARFVARFDTPRGPVAL